MRAPCAVKLEVFEGPLDLLLHLIRLNEVDVADIPIAAISAQYLEYLDLMRELDIDVAADYLVMAATLAHIKSRVLLPPADDETEEGPDPREELARRLAEYATFKEAAQELGQRAILERDVFSFLPDPDDVPQKEPVLEANLFPLLEALQRVLRELPQKAGPHEVTIERFSIQDRMVRVMDLLREADQSTLLFEELLRDGAVSRHFVVMTFLAILELTRIQALRIFQNRTEQGRPFGPIRARLAVLEEE
jgi:segregation and condensation protein A